MMKTELNINGSKQKILNFLLIISTLILVSCANKICSVYAKSEDRVNYRQSYNRSKYGAQNTISPYTEKYKAQLRKKYFGRK